MLSPKNLFQKNTDAVHAHNDLVSSAAFQGALQTALAQMAMDLPAGSDPDQQRDNSSRIMGARQFISTFTSLGIVETSSAKLKSDNLKH